MSGLPVILLAIVVALSVGAQPQPQPAPSVKGTVVSVEIVVANDMKVHEKACSGGNLSPTAVLVVGTEVRHCIDKVLLDHAEEKSKPEAFKKSLVALKSGDSVRWYSKTVFRVAQVRLHPPVEKGAPAEPFPTKLLPVDFLNEVISPPVVDVPGDVVQQYKVAFEIGKAGNRVDPDLICSM